VRIPPDPARRELDAEEVVGGLRAAAKQPEVRSRLDYSADIGSQVRAIVLDLARAGGYWLISGYSLIDFPQLARGSPAIGWTAM
jgi:hypothetical protein